MNRGRTAALKALLKYRRIWSHIAWPFWDEWRILYTSALKRNTKRHNHAFPVSENNIVTFLSLFRKDGRKISCQQDDFFLSISSFAVVMFSKLHTKANTEQMGWACGTYGGQERYIQSLVEKTEGKRPLGIPRCSWEENIKMDIQEVGREALEWINLDWDRDNWRTLVSVAMKLRVPWNAGISWLAEDLLASQEVLCSMELVSQSAILQNTVTRSFLKHCI